MTEALPYDAFVLYRDMLGVIPYENPWSTDDHRRLAMIKGTLNPQGEESHLPKRKKAKAMYRS